MIGRRRPSPNQYLANWRDSELPLAKKVGAALRNQTIKVRKRSHCCGHPGEPGC